MEALFTKLPEFQKPPRHPKWVEVNLAATVPGWRRFKAAQDWLDRTGREEPPAGAAGSGAPAGAAAGARRQSR